MLSLCKESISQIYSSCISKLDSLLSIVTMHLISITIKKDCQKAMCCLLYIDGKLTSLSCDLRNNIKGN